jgi:hypothetical protein
MIITVRIITEHNDNIIEVIKTEMSVGGKPQAESTICELTDEAKSAVIAALNA